MWGAIAAGAGALLGGIAGGQGDKSKQTTTTSVNMRSIDQLNRGRSGLEATGVKAQEDYFSQLQALLGQGPGASEVTAGLQSQNSLADLIQSMVGSGGLPNQAQIGQAQGYASQIFDPQRVAMQQSFQDQDIASQRLAAKLGRSGADPILRNKLAQEQTRQQAMLQSQQGAFASEQAMQQPQRQLQLAEALAQVRGGLASQALQNRQTLLGLGNQLAQSERDYRLRAAGSTSETRGVSGGGQAGQISGALAGAGMGMNLAGGLSSMFGSFGGSAGSGGGTPSGGGGANGMARMRSGF
jgi:hypothetical protein